MRNKIKAIINKSLENFGGINYDYITKMCKSRMPGYMVIINESRMTMEKSKVIVELRKYHGKIICEIHQAEMVFWDEF